MTLTLKPCGRGSWTPMVLRFEGKRASPLLVRKGDRITIGGITFRVCEVSA